MPRLKKISILEKIPIDANTLDLEEQKSNKTESDDIFQETPQIIRIKEYLQQRYDFRFNIISERIEFKQKSATRWVELGDRSRNNLLIELKLVGIKKPKDDFDMITLSDFTPEYSAPLAYFEAIKPADNGMIRALFDTLELNAEYELDSDVIYRLFKKYLIASYYCMIGKKVNDVMLMLLGKQGVFKTSWLNYLCPVFLQDMLITSNIDFSGKEHKNHLVEKVFINVDDQMEKIMTKDFNTMKSIISSGYETNRKAYARFENRRKRIANFLGSVNNPRFLSDVENRRYLCLPISAIKEGYRKINMDLVWSNVLYESKDYSDRYVFEAEDRKIITEINQRFVTISEEEELFDSFFVPATEADEQQICYMTMTEILMVLNDYSKLKLRSYVMQNVIKRKNMLHVSKRLKRINGARYVYKLKINTADEYCIRLLKPFIEDNENLF